MDLSVNRGRLENPFPVLSRLVLFVLIPVLVVIFFAFSDLYTSVPDMDINVSVDGVEHEVTVSRDQHGIATIEGQSDWDVFFAVGYVQAQDRLWQMENQRRLIQGRMSEVYGASSLQSDIFMRTLGLYSAAESAWDGLSQPAQASLQAYAAGVNTWLQQTPRLPPEFIALGVQPQEWKPVDSLAIAKLFALNLGSNLNQEIQLQFAKKVLSPAHFDSLYPALALPEVTASADIPTLTELLDFKQELKDKHFLGGKNVGSNAWVVSGALTSSGHSILANDPHLALQIPSLWYAVKLKGDAINVSGMTLAGLPVVVFGENDNIAWGGTNLPADVQDLVIEEVHPHDQTLYKNGAHWTEFEQRIETIHISQSFPKFLNKVIKPVKLQVKSTVNGPVIKNFFGDSEHVFSLRWTALNDKDSSYDALFKLNYAKDWQQFSNAISGFVAPTLNLFYTDKDNNIGFRAIGKIPRRANQHTGMLPAYGDFGRWNGYIDWADMPKEFNPARGYIADANNKRVSEDYSHFISNNWADPARAQRISSMLEQTAVGNEKIDLEYTRQMQLDVVDLNAKSLIAALKPFAHGHEANQPLFDALIGWDGNMQADSPAPLIYVSFLRNLRQQIYLDEFTGYFTSNNAKDTALGIVDAIEVPRVIKTLNSKLNWCDNTKTPDVENCHDSIVLAFDQSMRELSKLNGSNSAHWRWADAIKRKYQHLPFSQHKLTQKIFERQSIGDGTPDTINVAGYYFDESEGYIQNHGAGFRQVFEMTPAISHYFINSTGQSGNILSRFYDDTILPFEKSEWFSFDASSKTSVMVLTPHKTMNR